MAIRRVFVPKVEQDKQKVVIIGIDFGTSFTKVYFNQDGEIKQPIQFEVNGVKSFFLPTELFYNPKKNEVCLHELPDCEIIRYFKYSMISDELTTSTNLTNHNKSLKVKPELLCSVYFISFVFKMSEICFLTLFIKQARKYTEHNNSGFTFKDLL